MQDTRSRAHPFSLTLPFTHTGTLPLSHSLTHSLRYSHTTPVRAHTHIHTLTTSPTHSAMFKDMQDTSIDEATRSYLMQTVGARARVWARVWARVRVRVYIGVRSVRISVRVWARVRVRFILVLGFGLGL